MSTESPSVYAHFNNADAAGRVRLNTNGSICVLEKLPDGPSGGLAVRIFSEDLQANAVLRFSLEEGIWVAEVDWKAVEDL